MDERTPPPAREVHVYVETMTDPDCEAGRALLERETARARKHYGNGAKITVTLTKPARRALDA